MIKIPPFKQTLKFIFEILKTVAVMTIIAFVIKAYLIQTFMIDGLSMEPNFHHREYLLADKISYRFVSPQRGEVVIFKPHQITDPSRRAKADRSEEEDYYIKRIVGLPGETIKISNNRVYINNRQLDEPYLSPGTRTKPSKDSLQSKSYTLEEDEYFLLGDNRSNSKDSRSLGPIKSSQIQGRGFIILYPFSSFRMI
jgi:signal peptidase I